MSNTNGKATILEAKDNWVKGMEVVIEGKKWLLGWKGLVKNPKEGKNPYRAVLIDKANNRLWTDGQIVDTIIAGMHDSMVEDDEESAEGNLDINSEEIALILQSLHVWRKELLAYTNKAGISRFKKEDAGATIKAIKTLRDKLATIQ